MRQGSRALLPVLLILLLSAGLLSYSNRVLRCDEANTLYQYASDPLRALFSYATPNNHLLHSLQVWAITSLAGTSALVLRFPAFAALLIALALAYRVGRRLAGGDHRAGVLALILLGTAHIIPDFAINARGYTLAVALTLALIDLVFATSPVRFERRTYQYSLMAISAAHVLTLPSMILATGAVGLWVLVRQTQDQRYRLLIAPLIIGTLIGTIPYLPSATTGVIGLHLGAYGIFDLGVLLNEWSQMVFSTSSAPVISVFFGAALVLGVIAALVTRRHKALTATLVVVGVGVLAILMQYALTGRTLFARNYLYLIAPLVLLAGAGGVWLLRRATLPVALIILLISVSTWARLDSPEAFERIVIEQVNERVTASDWLIVGPCFNAPVLHYLTHNERSEVLFERPNIDRVVVLSREGTLDDTLALFDATNRVSACQPDPTWTPIVNAFTCTPVLDAP